MADIYVTRCPRCDKSFRTRKALETHFSKKHPGNELPENITFSFGDKQAPTVLPRLLKNRVNYLTVLPRLLKNRVNYLQWLVETVECINSAHNPCVPGKYRKLISFEFLELHLI